MTDTPRKQHHTLTERGRGAPRELRQIPLLAPNKRISHIFDLTVAVTPQNLLHSNTPLFGTQMRRANTTSSRKRRSNETGRTRYSRFCFDFRCSNTSYNSRNHESSTHRTPRNRCSSPQKIKARNDRTHRNPFNRLADPQKKKKKQKTRYNTHALHTPHTLHTLHYMHYMHTLVPGTAISHCQQHHAGSLA